MLLFRQFLWTSLQHATITLLDIATFFTFGLFISQGAVTSLSAWGLVGWWLNPSVGIYCLQSVSVNSKFKPLKMYWGKIVYSGILAPSNKSCHSDERRGRQPIPPQIPCGNFLAGIYTTVWKSASRRNIGTSDDSGR